MSEAREQTQAWIDRVQARIKRWQARGLGSRWVVAVSGGSDSVGLVRVLHDLAPRLGYELSLAHLNHGARGEAAQADAQFVAKLAAQLGLPLDLGQWRPERASHFEAEARAARYAWLAEVAAGRNACAVAVGHTRDDQAETILHRILRGTGMKGLAGMPARRPLNAHVALIRPLLDASRGEIRAFLATLGQPYREDATNADLARTRAQIRHDLLPRLAAEYNPNVSEALIRLGKLAGGSALLLQAELEGLARAAILEATADRIVLDRRVLARWPALLRAEVVRLIWRRAGWPERMMDAPRWRRLAALARQESGRLSVGSSVEATASDAELKLERIPVANLETQPIEPVALPVPGAVRWRGGTIVSILDPAEPCRETIDLSALALPLCVRAPRPGDRFAPLGMESGQMRLVDFLRSRRVPKAERPFVPLVCDQQGIIWVVGHRIAHRIRRTDQSRQLLGLRWQPLSDPENPAQ